MTQTIIAVSLEHVQQLLESQFPALASEPLVALESAGTDNHIFRLGTDKCVRLPKVDWAKETALRETGILAQLEQLPLTIPQVLATGKPGEGYPWNWSVLSWIDGEVLSMGRFADPSRAASRLAEFLHTLRGCRPDETFSAGPANNYRGLMPGIRARQFEAALPAVSERFDRGAIEAAWQHCLAGETETCRAQWLHGDIHLGNVLVEEGALSGIIDWGLAGVGDAACDLLSAWSLFDAKDRANFFHAVRPTEAEWLRGAGWALSMAVIYLPFAWREDLPSEGSERMLARVLEDLA